MTEPQSVHRRGVSMLLVLLSLAMATILTSAFLASRDNSSAIGGNIASASSSRWAAISGLQIGHAIMQTDTDWRTADPSGRLLDDHPIGNATVDLVVRDAVTGKPPTALSTTFDLTSTATVGDVRQVATASATVRPVDTAADVDLSEFTIFARDRIELGDRSIVTRWPKAPLNEFGHGIAIGTQNTSSATVMVFGDAAAVDTKVYHGPGASSSLIINWSGPAIAQEEIGGTIPMPLPPNPAVSAPSGVLPPALDIGAGQETITAVESYFPDITVAASGRLNLVGAATLVSLGDLRLSGGGQLNVSGETTVVVLGDLTIEAGAILLGDTATLDLYVRGDLSLVDGYIGNASAAGPDLDSTGSAEWMNPQRIHIFGNDTGDTAGWSISGNSVVKASVYSPSGQISIADQSAVYGRLAADRVILDDDAAVFYDHTMDSGSGYTKADALMFDGDGRILSSFVALGSLDDANLVVAADHTSMAISAYGKTYADGQRFDGDFAPNTGGGFAQPPEPGTPTPRPAVVDFEFDAFGASITDWERGAS